MKLLINLTNGIYLFYNFLATYNKSYSHQGYKNFLENLDFINNHNINTITSKLSINQFSDIKLEDFIDKYLGLYRSSDDNNCEIFETNSYDLFIPENFDWRYYNVVTPVKNQLACGSCWAFACTEVAESNYAITNHKLLELSPQELVDCVTDNNGCSGGLIDNTLEYIINHGLDKNVDYPYKAKDGICHEKDTKFRPKVCFSVEPNNEIEIQKALLTQGPLVAAIQADSRIFQFYNSGVITSNKCGIETNHAIQIVGYGIDKETKIPYWTIRNSWGEKWGEDGYVRIERTYSKNNPGVCGIATSVFGFYSQNNINTPNLITQT